MHEDGEGGDTDSLHFNAEGFNEVIFFQSNLTPEQKTDVFHCLNGPNTKHKRTREFKHALTVRQFLPPHTVTENYYRKSFPTKKQLQKLKEEKSIDYKCFILKPKQLLFINAGRLHIFRKMGYTDLPDTDPFYELRKDYIGVGASIENQRWNISFAWDFMYIGHQMERILPLAQLKWYNGVCAAQYNFGSLGCIETPIMILLTRYGKASKKNRKKGFMKQIDLLLSALEPLIATIIKYHGDLLPLTTTTGIGTVVNTTRDPRFKGHKERLNMDVINFRCDSCKYHLSNHFLTCRTCLGLEDYAVNICTSCYVVKGKAAIFKDVNSKIHKYLLADGPTEPSECVATQNCNKSLKLTGQSSCDVCDDENHGIKELFEDTKVLTKLLSNFHDKDFFAQFVYPNRSQNHDSCKLCKAKCLRCNPETCLCHNSYELAHLWATEKELRNIFHFNRNQSSKSTRSTFSKTHYKYSSFPKTIFLKVIPATARTRLNNFLTHNG